MAMPKTLDDFNAEQHRLQEQTRLSQQTAAESLHAYRGNVDEKELRRRAAAEELRRKEMEAKEGLHGYRGRLMAVEKLARMLLSRQFMLM